MAAAADDQLPRRQGAGTRRPGAWTRGFRPRAAACGMVLSRSRSWSPALDVDDADLRASRLGSQIVGLVMARYIVGVQPLASLPPERVATAIARHFSAISLRRSTTIDRYTAPTTMALGEDEHRPRQPQHVRVGGRRQSNDRGQSRHCHQTAERPRDTEAPGRGVASRGSAGPRRESGALELSWTRRRGPAALIAHPD